MKYGELKTYPNFGSVKVTVNRMKRQATDWQHFSNYLYAKELCPEHKELPKFNQISNPSKKWAEKLNRCCTEAICE